MSRLRYEKVDRSSLMPRARPPPSPSDPNSDGVLHDNCLIDQHGGAIDQYNGLIDHYNGLINPDKAIINDITKV